MITSSRGQPIRAICYQADQRDELDIQLCWQLLSLDRTFAASLMVKRLGYGEYELDGKRLRIDWAKDINGGGGGGNFRQELVVKEAVCGNDDPMETPLGAYLRQAADVAASLGGRLEGSPLIARVPSDKRLTFASPPCRGEHPDMDRVKSMRMACEQARLRELGAEAFERQMSLVSNKQDTNRGAKSVQRLSGRQAAAQGGSASRAQSASAGNRAMTPDGRGNHPPGGVPRPPGAPLGQVMNGSFPRQNSGKYQHLVRMGSAPPGSMTRATPPGGGLMPYPGKAMAPALPVQPCVVMR